MPRSAATALSLTPPPPLPPLPLLQAVARQGLRAVRQYLMSHCLEPAAEVEVEVETAVAAPLQPGSRQGRRGRGDDGGGRGDAALEPRGAAGACAACAGAAVRYEKLGEQPAVTFGTF